MGWVPLVHCDADAWVISLYTYVLCTFFIYFFHPIPIHCLKILSQRRGLGANFFFFFRGRYVEGIQLITPSIYIRFFSSLCY